MTGEINFPLNDEIAMLQRTILLIENNLNSLRIDFREIIKTLAHIDINEHQPIVLELKERLELLGSKQQLLAENIRLALARKKIIEELISNQAQIIEALEGLRRIELQHEHTNISASPRYVELMQNISSNQANIISLNSQLMSASYDVNQMQWHLLALYNEQVDLNKKLADVQYLVTSKQESVEQLKKLFIDTQNNLGQESRILTELKTLLASKQLEQAEDVTMRQTDATVEVDFNEERSITDSYMTEDAQAIDACDSSSIQNAATALFGISTRALAAAHNSNGFFRANSVQSASISINTNAPSAS